MLIRRFVNNFAQKQRFFTFYVLIFYMGSPQRKRTYVTPIATYPYQFFKYLYQLCKMNSE
jgi:hypothetical protein